MSTPRMGLTDKIRDLPRLANASVQQTHHTPTNGPRTPAGPRLPPGTDMNKVDAENGRQRAEMLQRLSLCIRIICEEMPTATYTDAPELTPEGHETWHSESSWLLKTMDWWTHNTYCHEWVTDTIDYIYEQLIEITEQRNRWTNCAICGSDIAKWETATIAIAECPDCQRVIGMSPRTLTTSQAADELGIGKAGVRKRVERGQILKIGTTPQGESLLMRRICE